MLIANIVIKETQKCTLIPIKSMANFLNLEGTINNLSDGSVEITYQGNGKFIKRMTDFIKLCNTILITWNKHKDSYGYIEVMGAAIKKQNNWINYLTKLTAMCSGSPVGKNYEEIISDDDFIIYRCYLKLEAIFERVLGSELITQQHSINHQIQKGDCRTTILSSEEAEQFGVKWPSLLCEIWCREEDVPTKPDITPNGGSKNYENAHAAIKDLIRFDLDENDERIGNVLIFLPDYRARLVKSDEIDYLFTIEYHGSLISANDLTVGRETIEFEDVLSRNTINLSELEKASPEGGLKIRLVELDSNRIVETVVPSEYWVGEPSGDIIELFDKRTMELLDRRETPLIRRIGFDLSVVSDNSKTTDRIMVESPKPWEDRTKKKRRPRYIDSMLICADKKVLKKALDTISKHIYGYVEIVDPYLSVDWVDFIFILPDNVDVRIITSKPGDKLGNQKDIIQRLKTLHKNNKIEIIKITDKNGGPTGTPLHDRFILTKDIGWQIGTSLNSAYKNYTNIMELVNKWDIEEIFDFLWDKNKAIQDSRGGYCTREKIYP
ncbi:MAG: acylphosphatase [Euryarchaeota archaeon]|nr:acylphosphatase [Euryarchaeota archaeon]